MHQIILLCYKNSLSETIQKLIRTIDDKIRDEKVQYDINGKTAKISVLSLGKIDKYEYLTDKKKLPPDQRKVKEQSKFTYSPLGKSLGK